MMDCKRFRRKLEGSLRAAGFLAGRGRAHREACADCRAAGEAACRMQQELRALGGGVAPQELEQVVMARVAALRPLPWFASLRVRWAAAGGVVMAALVAGALYLGGPGRQPTERQAMQPLVQAYTDFRASGVTGDAGIALVGEVEELF